jgi:hypothetical protein
MELSLRLDTLGMLEMRYLRGRERYRDWPPFLLLAASRQARVLAYLTRDAVEELHQQILAVEEAAGLAVESDDEDDEDEGEGEDNGEIEESKEVTPKENEASSSLSPAFAQALEKLNDLARQRLPDGSTNPVSEELAALREAALGDEDDDDDALEQLQDAFVQMMEVVKDLAEELSTEALKVTGRLRCARTEVFFTQADTSVDDVEDEEDEESGEAEQITLALILRLYEEGHARPDDLPAIELQLDVDDFEGLHETLDTAIDRERRSRRRH